MKPFETKLTLRIYDTKLIENMNMIMKFNPNKYQSKNQLLLELLELGVREKLKEIPTPPTTPASAAKSIPSQQRGENCEQLKQIKELIENMHRFNQQSIEGVLAHLKMSERLASSIYNIVFAILKDEPVLPVQIELGYLDDVPKRFTDFLGALLVELSKKSEKEDDEEAEDIHDKRNDRKKTCKLKNGRSECVGKYRICAEQ